MNHSRKLLPAIVGGLSLLTVAAFGQHQNHDLSTPPTPETVNPVNSPASKSTEKEDTTATSVSRFKSLDADSDGRISRSEFATAPNGQFVTARSSAQVEKTDKIAAGTTDTNFKPTSTNSYETFNKIDTDKDGFLSKSEIEADTSGAVSKE